MPTYKTLPDGRCQLTHENKDLGLGRTRKIFARKKDAKEYIELREKNAKRILMGHKARRLFGETLADYLAELEHTLKPTNPTQYNHILSLVKNLRHPVLCAKTRTWIRLEELPLEKWNDGEYDIIDGLNIWTADQKKILKRAYINKQHYQQRNKGGTKTWYKQPDPFDPEHTRPQIRTEINDKHLIQQLNQTKGRGTVASDTLRIRQALVSRVLSWAYKSRQTEQNQSTLIKRETPGARRDITICSWDQFKTYLYHLPTGADLATYAALFIGWRKSNLLGLTWSRVIFPVYDQHNTLIQPGCAWVDSGYNTQAAQRTKNKEKLIHPMTIFTEQILRVAWDQRNGDLVFHKNGKPIGDIRKSQETAKQKAGIQGNLPPWHGWRHHFSTSLGLSGASTIEMMAAGGWKQSNMPGHYTHIHEIEQAAQLIPLLEKMQRNIMGEKT